MKGIIKIIATIALYKALLCSNPAIVFENININIIIIISIMKPIAYAVINNFLLSYLFSADSLLIDI